MGVQLELTPENGAAAYYGENGELDHVNGDPNGEAPLTEKKTLRSRVNKKLSSASSGLHQFGENVSECCGGVKQRAMDFSCKDCLHRTCTPQNVRRKIPIVEWLPKYRFSHFQGDIIAGLTVALTVIPQGLAYAVIAELPPQYGLYSAFMGCFIYCILGTSKDITLGPTAIMSLMTAAFGTSPVANDATYAILLTLACGIVQLIMGIFSLGFLVDFISFPVINSFTVAAAITIAFGQVKKWLGLQHIPREFLHQVYETFKHLPETRIWDFTMGLVCMIVLFIFKYLRQRNWNTRDVSLGKRIFVKAVWLLGTSRNAIVVIVASGLVAGLEMHIPNIEDYLTLTGKIDARVPSFRLPDFSVSNNGTTYNFPDIAKHIGPGFIIVPILGVVETMAIGKAFARKNDYKIDANQELIAIGASNLVGCLVGSYPVTGSFSRTAVNSQSGVRTPGGGVWTGALVLIALAFLTPLFRFIPQAALAGVIIMAVLDMVSFKLLVKLWKVKRLDILPWMVTFIFSFLLGIEYGIIIGIGLSMLMLLYPWTRPSLKVVTEESVPVEGASGDVTQREAIVVQLDQGIYYPGIEYIKTKIYEVATADEVPRSVVLDCQHLAGIDYSCVQGIQVLLEDFHSKGLLLVLSNLQPHVLEVLQKAELPHMRLCPTTQDAIKMIIDTLKTSPVPELTIDVTGPSEAAQSTSKPQDSANPPKATGDASDAGAGPSQKDETDPEDNPRQSLLNKDSAPSGVNADANQINVDIENDAARLNPGPSAPVNV